MVYYKRGKAKNLLPIVFTLIATTQIFDYNFPRYGVAINLSYYSVFVLISFFALGAAAFSTLNRYHENIFIVIASATVLIYELDRLLFDPTFMYCIKSGLAVPILICLSGSLGRIAICVALLVFGIFKPKEKSDYEINEHITFKCKKTITALTVFSLYGAIFSCMYLFKSKGLLYSFSTFKAKNFLFHLDVFSSLILPLIPPILVILCFAKFQNRLVGRILFSSALVLIAITPIWNLLDTYKANFIKLEADVIIHSVCALAFCVPAICTLIRRHEKIFTLAPSAAFVLFYLVNISIYFFNFSKWLSYTHINTIIFDVIVLLAEAALYVALILYALCKDKIMYTSEGWNPAVELAKLNDQLELGQITEEEYTAQRSDIISKL